MTGLVCAGVAMTAICLVQAFILMTAVRQLVTLGEALRTSLNASVTGSFTEDSLMDRGG